MEENEVVELSVILSSQEAEESIESLLAGFESLKGIAKEIGTAISKAFTPVQKTLENAETGIHAMTEALGSATSTLQDLMAQLADEQVADNWIAGISTALEGVFAVVDFKKLFGAIGPALKGVLSEIPKWFSMKLIPMITGLFTGGKIVGAFKAVGTAIGGAFQAVGGAVAAAGQALNIGTGGMIALIAAVVAAITAVIVYWDEIVYFFTDTIPRLWGQFVTWISGVASVVGEALGSAAAAVGAFAVNCWNALVSAWNGLAQWVQVNVIQPIIDFFTPVVAWFSELFSSIGQTIADIFYNIGVIVVGCWEIIKAAWGLACAWFNENVIVPVCSFLAELWETVKNAVISAWEGIKQILATVGEWIYTNVVAPVGDFLSGLWASFVNGAIAAWEGVKAALAAVGDWFYTNVVSPVGNFLSGVWTGFLEGAKAAWEGIKSVFSKVGEFFGNIFKEAWEKVVNVFSIAGEIFNSIKDGILSAFIKIANGIIEGINSAIKVPFDGINFALESLRDMEIFGITPFSGLKNINVPQIPYLAKGAVLPANKPFLAMVGDQRHGTNVEAPLATIQEAVALVMNDQVAAMMAGFEATVEEVRLLRQLVSGIEIGDKTIGQAARRYERKMAVVTGGRY